MNRYLVLVIGKQFVHPMFISGDEEKMFQMLGKESEVNNHYLYLIYKYFEPRDIYSPYKQLSKGFYRDFTGYLVPGVVYDGEW